MRQLFRAIRKVAGSNAPVFICGESGTGKELTARALHEGSARRAAPFVAINCTAIAPHLMQSELFGHERGAFTGAVQRKLGRVEAANGGTVFLDEIGDMPIEAQAGLLRFLQEGSIERLGGHDIALLVHHVLQKFKADGSRRIRGFTPAAIQAMQSHPWPGNVRELINRVRRAIVLTECRLISEDDLGLSRPDRQGITLEEARSAAERNAIETALAGNGGRIGDAAAELGVSRSTLYRPMTLHALHDPHGSRA